MAEWLQTAWPWAAIVLGFGVLITVHELGHFLAAKWAGIKVEIFQVGFGHAVLSWTRGGTRYSLGWIPFGGFVKMKGEALDEERTSDPDDYSAQSPGKRAVVITAGVVMNTVCAFVCFALAFQFGVRSPSNLVGGVEPGSPAWEAGIAPGDRVVRVNGEETPTFLRVMAEVIHAPKGEALAVKVESSGAEAGAATIREYRITPEYDEARGAQRLGVEPARSNVTGAVAVDSAGAHAGLRPGDRILQVGATPTADDVQVQQAVRRLPADAVVALTIERDGERRTLPKVALQPRVDWDCGIFTSTSLLLERVLETGPAGRAGIVSGERIVGYKDAGGEETRDIRSRADFTSWLRRHAGEPATLLVAAPGSSDEAVREVALILPKSAELGVNITPPKGNGIIALDPEGPAALAGLQVGDTIVALRLNVSPAVEDQVVAPYVELTRADDTIPSEFPEWPWLVCFVAMLLAMFSAEAISERLGRPMDPETPMFGASRLVVVGVVVALTAAVVFPWAYLTVPEATTSPSPLWKLTVKDAKSQAQTSIAASDSVLESFHAYLRTQPVADAPAKVTVEFTRGASPAVSRVEFAVRADPARAYGLIGISFSVDQGLQQTDNVATALAWGWDSSLYWGREIFRMLRSLIWQKTVSFKNLGGPGQIGYISHQAASEGMGNWLHILGLLGMNLAVLNILPIPVLDGGHLMFIIIEAVRRKPVGEHWQMRFQTFGLVLLLTLMVVVFRNDVLFLFDRWF